MIIYKNTIFSAMYLLVEPTDFHAVRPDVKKKPNFSKSSQKSMQFLHQM